MEVWKDIKGFVGKYKLSIHGEVASLDREINGRLVEGRILCQAKIDGYPSVVLYKDGVQHTRLVHRLVAEHFLKGSGYVIHLDGDRTNNEASNLKWVDNFRHIAIYCPELDMEFESIKACAIYLQEHKISKMKSRIALQSRISQVKNGQIPHYRNLTFKEIE